MTLIYKVLIELTDEDGDTTEVVYVTQDQDVAKRYVSNAATNARSKWPGQSVTYELWVFNMRGIDLAIKLLRDGKSWYKHGTRIAFGDFK